MSGDDGIVVAQEERRAEFVFGCERPWSWHGVPGGALAYAPSDDDRGCFAPPEEQPEPEYEVAEFDSDGTLVAAPSTNKPFARYLADMDVTDARTPRERLEEYLSRHGVKPVDAESAA